MGDLVLNFVLFVSIYLIGFLSVSGFGKLFVNKNNLNYNKGNFFDLQIFGTIVLLVSSYLIYITIGTNHFINIFILFFGVIIYFFYKKDLNRVKLIHLIGLLIIILPILLISKTHEDFISYHFPFIEIVTNSKLVLGLGKVEINYIYLPFYHIN